MKKIRIVIIGAGYEGSSLYHCFRKKSGIQVVGIADVTRQGLGLEVVRNEGTIVVDNLEDVFSIPNVHVIIETTNIPNVREMIYKLKEDNTQVIESNGLDLLINLGIKKDQAEAEMLSVLGSIQDAVEIVNNKGIITYVNPTFETLTGISREERIGQNVFEIMPDSPLVTVIRTGETIKMQKGYVECYGKDLIFNVSPIMVRNEIQGAVAVFRSLTDVVKLMEELQRSTSIIEGLYEKLNKLNGLSEMNVSDVMPIDKMEQLLLRQALTKFGYSVEGKKKAAKALNISLATLYNKLKKYEIS